MCFPSWGRRHWAAALKYTYTINIHNCHHSAWFPCVTSRAVTHPSRPPRKHMLFSSGGTCSQVAAGPAHFIASANESTNSLGQKEHPQTYLDLHAGVPNGDAQVVGWVFHWRPRGGCGCPLLFTSCFWGGGKLKAQEFCGEKRRSQELLETFAFAGAHSSLWAETLG